MAIYESSDLLTLATKQLLIGSSIQMEDNTWKEVADYEFAMATDQICVKFTDNEQNFFMIKEKFKVDVPGGMTRINTGKVKKHKK